MVTMISPLSNFSEEASRAASPAAEAKSPKEKIKSEGGNQNAYKDGPVALAERLNKLLAQANSRLSIKVDKETSRVVYQIIDGQTGEVLRQVPPEELLRVAAYFAKLSAGKLINTKI